MVLLLAFVGVFVLGGCGKNDSYVISISVPAGTTAEAVPAPDVPATGMTLTPPPADPPATKRELTAEEKFMQASSVLWPTKKHAGRTLGQVMQMDPSAIEWLANRYDRNPDVSAAAKYICEYALNHQSA